MDIGDQDSWVIGIVGVGIDQTCLDVEATAIENRTEVIMELTMSVSRM
jgi:hypothetical protein